MNINGNNGISESELLTSMLFQKVLQESDSTNCLAFAALLNNISENNTKIENGTSYQVRANQNLLDIPLQTTNYNYRINQNSGINKISSVNVVDSSENVPQDLMSRIEKAVSTASAKYGIDKELIMEIIHHESRFQPDVTSSAGAQGLMQILPSNFSLLGITDGYNVEQNIDGGTKLLRKCIDLYNGNLEMGVIAYAGGSGVMSKRGVKSYDDLYKMPAEARKAVPEILEGYKLRKQK